MTKTTATILVIAILALVGVGVFALTPAGRNLAYNDTYPDVPNTGSVNQTTTYTPPRNTTNVYNNAFYSTTTYATTTFPSPRNNTRHVVTYSNERFNPQVLVVARGDSVTFLNNSTSTIRVQGLPGFDILGTINPAGSWTYDFNSTGTYGYSNYFNSKEGGTIVVQ